MEMSPFDPLTPRLPLLLDSQGGEDLSDHVTGQRGVSRCGTDLERNVQLDQINMWIEIKHLRNVSLW